MTTFVTSRPAVTIRRFDHWLLACAVSLSVIGVAMVYSTTWTRLVADGDPGGYFATRQALFVVLGMIAAWIVYRLERPALIVLAASGYGASILGLLAVLSPLGTTINGTRAWLTLPGGFTLQPAEFAKVFTVLLAALWLSDRQGARGLDDPPEARAVLGVLGAAGLVCALLLLQPDLGSAIVIGAAVLGVLFVAGVRRRLLVILLVGGAAAAVSAYVLGVLDAYQVARFTAFLDPGADPQHHAPAEPAADEVAEVVAQHRRDDRNEGDGPDVEHPVGGHAGGDHQEGFSRHRRAHRLEEDVGPEAVEPVGVNEGVQPARHGPAPGCRWASDGGRGSEGKPCPRPRQAGEFALACPAKCV